MYTFPYDKPAPGARLRLTTEMIERRLNVQPFDITIDVPLMFERLPEEVRQIILQALAADASVEEEDIQQDTITVFAGVSCHVHHHARHSPNSHSVFAMVEDGGDICLTAYAFTTQETGTEPVSAILDTIGAYFALDGKTGESEDAEAYISHIIDDMRILAFVDDSTTFDLLKKVP